MSYESDAALYKMAATEAILAAGMIMQPWAFYVAAAIGVMVSDPGAMSKSAKAWRSIDQDGLVSQLDDLDEGLTQFKKQLKSSGKWEGTAADTFDGVLKAFRNGIKSLKDSRNGTGEAIDAAAKAFHVGALFAVTIASGMLALGLYKLASKLNLGTAVIAEAVSAARARITLQAVRSMLWKQTKVVGGVSLVLFAAIQYTEMTGKLFPGLEASIPTEMSSLKSGGAPPFSDAGLAYDEKMGGLTVKMDDSLTGKLPGGIGQA